MKLQPKFDLGNGITYIADFEVTEKMLKDFTPSKATSLDTWEVHYLLARTPVTAAMNPNPHKVGLDDDIADVAKQLGDEITVRRFIRYQVGEAA